MAAFAESSVSQRLAKALDQFFRAGSLPDAVRDHAAVLMLDTHMVALAGFVQPDVRAVSASTANTGGAPEAGLWSGDARVPMAEAAFANALAASALDFDSLHGNVHPSAIVQAAAWAAGEAIGASGQQVLKAFVLGSELICKLAESVQGPQKGWTIGTVLGVFGAAAAVGLLMGLGPERLQHALGLCLSMAAGSQQANVEQVLAKRLQPAFAARAGVVAAQLARAGMTAPAQVFEGRFGLWALYFPGDADVLPLDFGHGYAMLRTGLKQYPVCACSHAAMEAFRDLLACTSPNDVARVEASISPFMDRLVGAP
ncbi:MAG: MmgE/PrpD family protein, partial [Pigmentiphaga sp.]